jgi:hypothetical protein
MPEIASPNSNTTRDGTRNMFHSLSAPERHCPLDSSRRVRLSTDGTGFQQV